jgi:hypothetical protein
MGFRSLGPEEVAFSPVPHSSIVPSDPLLARGARADIRPLLGNPVTELPPRTEAHVRLNHRPTCRHRLRNHCCSSQVRTVAICS